MQPQQGRRSMSALSQSWAQMNAESWDKKSVWYKTRQTKFENLRTHEPRSTTTAVHAADLQAPVKTGLLVVEGGEEEGESAAERREKKQDTSAESRDRKS